MHMRVAAELRSYIDPPPSTTQPLLLSFAAVVISPGKMRGLIKSIEPMVSSFLRATDLDQCLGIRS
jgi:hypothetical protein